LVEFCVQHAQCERRLLTGTVRDHLLRDLKHVHSAKVKGDMRLGVLSAADRKVYPELVIRNDAGRVDGMRYDELAPMLLNEVQQQQQKMAAQAAEIRQLKQQQKQLVTHAELNNLKEELQAALAKLQSKDELVAQR
jgi:hypothetical protein